MIFKCQNATCLGIKPQGDHCSGLRIMQSLHWLAQRWNWCFSLGQQYKSFPND